MNFMAAKAGAGAVDVPGLRRSVPTAARLPAAGQALTIGLRPEHLSVDPAGDTHKVEMTEALGGVSYAYLMSETGERLIVEERGDERSRAGGRVGVAFDPTRAYLFDAQSGLRVR
jgi:lactose/L-arabinose transport system ATP-binding protein